MSARTTVRNAARMLYVIKRGPKPDTHVAPFHPVIVCANRAIAQWQAGDGTERAWVWSKPNDEHVGFLLVRWEGLDLDYGFVVKGVPLPDGTPSAFAHEHLGGEPWSLLAGAVWFSERHRIPAWLIKRGVVAASDEFTRKTIRQDEDYCDPADPHRFKPRRPW